VGLGFSAAYFLVGGCRSYNSRYGTENQRTSRLSPGFLAKRPEGIADAVSKLSSARDVSEGYKSAKELMRQAGSYLQDKAMSLYQYF
jgi:hypothetical protein